MSQKGPQVDGLSQTFTDKSISACSKIPSFDSRHIKSASLQGFPHSTQELSPNLHSLYLGTADYPKATNASPARGPLLGP